MNIKEILEARDKLNEEVLDWWRETFSDRIEQCKTIAELKVVMEEIREATSYSDGEQRELDPLIIYILEAKKHILNYTSLDKS